MFSDLNADLNIFCSTDWVGNVVCQWKFSRKRNWHRGMIRGFYNRTYERGKFEWNIAELVCESWCWWSWCCHGKCLTFNGFASAYGIEDWRDAGIMGWGEYQVTLAFGGEVIWQTVKSHKPATTSGRAKPRLWVRPVGAKMEIGQLNIGQIAHRRKGES
jgi:hypothetical protein